MEPARNRQALVLGVAAAPVLVAVLWFTLDAVPGVGQVTALVAACALGIPAGLGIGVRMAGQADGAGSEEEDQG